MLRTDDPDEQDNAMVHQLFLHMLGPVLVSWLVSEMSLACQYGVSSNTEQDRTRVCRYLWDRFIVCSCPGRRYPALGKMVKSWLSWIRIWCNSLGSNSAFSAQYSISIFWSEGNKKALGSSQIHDNRERERQRQIPTWKAIYGKSKDSGEEKLPSLLHGHTDKACQVWSVLCVFQTNHLHRYHHLLDTNNPYSAPGTAKFWILCKWSKYIWLFFFCVSYPIISNILHCLFWFC